MMLLEQKAYGLEDLPAIAETLLHFAGKERVFCFYAPMGAGKTTFIKALCRQLQSQSDFSSPTYSLVNEYTYPEGKIFHFDLYRLKAPEEAFDIGMDEYLESGNFCFIEWPERIDKGLLSSFLSIEISILNNIRYFRARHKTE
jgi:tRNA threonylcarbamoyladenosine biosynthesis protein TsaE